MSQAQNRAAPSEWYESNVRNFYSLTLSILTLCSFNNLMRFLSTDPIWVPGPKKYLLDK